ncbi:hypothetical protein D1AOALGA4SA_10870 [Olavius algarvensis Delta 1 endosymbiont]|nr:hypothetical protein D1AOALGA4SA_10870 [Olavius algarvensis Delta 1 endosymbiont]
MQGSRFDVAVGCQGSVPSSRNLTNFGVVSYGRLGFQIQFERDNRTPNCPTPSFAAEYSAGAAAFQVLFKHGVVREKSDAKRSNPER